MSYKIEKKDGGWVVGGERFATQERATRHLIALLSGAESPAPKPSRPSSAPPRPRPSSAPPRPRPSGKKAVRPRNEEEIFFHPFRVLGGGLIETAEGEGVTQRPFVVVEVSPGKARSFYMSTGTGGQTNSGEWNLFGGIADWGQAHFGWFIKPVEGKRVEKYSDVAAFLTEKFGSKAAPAWKAIRLSVPNARVFSEAGGGKAPERSGQYEAAREAWSRLNKYLADLGAIEKYSPDEARPKIRRGGSREGGAHGTVHQVARVSFNPRRW